MEQLLIQSRGLRFAYRQQGTGEPVLLIHGFPETSYEWRHQMPALAEAGYACFAPDTRGFGGTDKPGARVSRSLLARDIADFMDAVGIEKAAVIAHDWGGIIGSKFALDYPERVTRLALLDTLVTVWVPQGVHGYWFKAEPLPEEFFAKHHAGFIETIFAGGTEPALPGRPQSPWRGGGTAMPTWATQEDIDHYRKAFADPASHFHAISYYRYGLPFHRVIADASVESSERYESLSEQTVAGMWLHPEGMEQHPLYANYMDYGPEDRQKRYEGPTLWMFARYGQPSERGGTEAWEKPPTGNPFVEQFPRYFPDLRVRTVPAGHFFAEEAPEATNEALLAFLRE
jgi:pimeloyl-ACP methyl ester carboxylesterase